MPRSDQEARLNILHIASWYPSRRSLQNGNFIQRHIQAIGQFTNSFALHVVSDPALESWADVEVEHTEHQAVIVVYPKGSFWNRFTRNIKAHQFGFQECKGDLNQFDLIHVHVMFPGMAFAKRLAQKLGVPVVVTEHATAYHDYHPEQYNWWQWFYLKWYSRSVQRFFPVSGDLKAAMIGGGIKGAYQVIPNVVDTQIFRPGSEVPNSDTFEFIHVSSLKDSHKNVSGLLSVFTEVADKYEQARLTIIGNDHHEQIQRYINLLKLTDKVKLLREVPIDEVAEHLQRSHALVLFSNYENAPCVISEAHCVGIPVVATDVGGVSEMVDKTNGLLVHPGDLYGMYTAMGKVIGSYTRYDRQAIHLAASVRYAYDKVGDQYLQAYKQVLRRN